MLLTFASESLGIPEQDTSTMTSTSTVKLQSIGAHDFNALADQTGLGQDAREMARLHLVEGLAMPEVGERFGVTRQRVRLAVEAIRRVHQAGVTRTGSVRVDVEIPEALAGPLGDFLEALRTASSKDAKGQAIAQVGRALAAARSALTRG
jgi:hypothetical protein